MSCAMRAVFIAQAGGFFLLFLRFPRSITHAPNVRDEKDTA